jgi:hypothetical protein
MEVLITLRNYPYVKKPRRSGQKDFLIFLKGPVAESYLAAPTSLHPILSELSLTRCWVYNREFARKNADQRADRFSV